MQEISKNNILGFDLIYYNDSNINWFDLPTRFYRLIERTKRKDHYQRAHEYCSGHGASGFTLLDRNLCDHLVLSDIFEPAVKSCQLTAEANNWTDRVSIYQTSSLNQTPKEELWDLFLVNPPWGRRPSPGPKLTPNQMRTLFDLEFKMHKQMYQSIGDYLTNDADVYILEDYRYSHVEEWQDMIKQAGLTIQAVYSMPYFVPRINNAVKSLETTYVMHLIKE